MFRKSLAIYVFIYLALSLNPAATARATDADMCHKANPIDPDTTHRGFRQPTTEAECFTTEIPAAGTLMLEVSVPGGSEAEPWLDFLEYPCTDSEVPQEAPRFRARTADSLVLDIAEPGPYTFCVAAQDPRHSMGDYRVTSGFATAGSWKDDPDEYQPEPDPFADCSSNAAGYRTAGMLKDDPDEYQPEPDPFANGSSNTASYRRIGILKDDPDEYQPEPDPFANGSSNTPSYRRIGILKDDPDEYQPEPDPVVFIPHTSSCDLQRICQRRLADDHGDLSHCATPVNLGHPVTGEIRNDWGDDYDYFTFLIEELTSVRIETTGDGQLYGSLYDHNGYRLRDGDRGTEPGNLRMVKTLSPGRYVVRVEGRDGAEGAYELDVARLDRKE